MATTVTISLRIGRTLDGERVQPPRDTVDLEQLSPRARALAEAVDASLSATASTIWIESDQPRGEQWRSEEQRAAYGDPDRDTEPRRQQWSAWDRFYADAPESGEWYLERQAAKIPAGWHIVGAVDPGRPPEQVPTTDRELTAEQVVATIALHRPGTRMTARTFRSYASRGQAPQPVRHAGRAPLWDSDVILEWLRARPGPGARTDLRKQQR